MGSTQYYDVAGDLVDHTDLRIEKAAELTLLLQSEVLPFARLVECRRVENGEVVVLNIEPEVPQHPEHDIRTAERIAVVFDENDQKAPEPLALRESFPITPHQNVCPDGNPRSLCLYEVSYEERRPRWTAAQFVQRLHAWLAQAAVGKLHGEEQSLEQLFLNTRERIVLPSSLYQEEAASAPQQLWVYHAGETRGRATFVAKSIKQPEDQNGETPFFIGFAYDAEPRTHGLIRVQPRSIAELASYLTGSGENLLSALWSRFKEWNEAGQLPLESRLMILLRVPKRRFEEGPAESVEVWAFATENPVSEIGEDIGLWEMRGDSPGFLVPVDEERQGENTELYLLNPTSALNPSWAAEMNGLPKASELKHIAVGAGALGSQVIVNLARGGQGQWTVVDEDQLLPHNVARHLLPGSCVGQSKAETVAAFMNSLFEDDVATPVVANVLLEKQEELAEAYAAADAILDMSTSLAVARHLALDIEGDARRGSMFLSPHGQDLVLITESRDRSLRLDQLEMEYYRALVTNNRLADHLLENGERLRYANSCRDVSTELPQDLVALHAGVGARAYRQALEEPADPTIKLWRAADNGSVESTSIMAAPHAEFEVGEWTVSVSRRLLSKLHQQRADRLPNETGGVLIGAFDTQRRRIYVVHHVPSPPDSEEWPKAYVRGSEGLQETLEQIDGRTAGQLGYVGEWHSHPEGADTQASDDDKELFEWLTEYRRRDGLPAVMTIVSSADRSRWFVNALTNNTETVSNQA